MAIFHFYYTDSTFTQRVKSEIYGFSEFLCTLCRRFATDSYDVKKIFFSQHRWFIGFILRIQFLECS